jgi:hypothetical protein
MASVDRTRRDRLGAAMPWLFAALAAASFTARGWTGPDLWRYLAVGSRIASTFSAQPELPLLIRQEGYVNFYWLFQVTLFELNRIGGVALLAIAFAGVWSWLAVTWVRWIRPFRREALGLPLALASWIAIGRRFEIRAEGISYVLLFLTLGWAARWSPFRPTRVRRFATLAAIQAVWCNCHGYFVLGPLVLGWRALSVWLVSPRRGRIGTAGRRAAAAIGVALAASLISPFGWRNAIGVATLASLAQSAAVGQIRELAPLGLHNWEDAVVWCLVAATAITAAWQARRGRRALYPIGLAAAGTVLGIRGLRYLPLMVILSTPLWRRGVATIRLPRSVPAVRAITAPLVAALALTTLVYAVIFLRAGRRPPVPPELVGFWHDRVPSGPIFDDPNLGSYLEWRYPSWVLYGDCFYFDPLRTDEYFAALVDPARFEDLDRQFHFGEVLLDASRSGALIAALLRHPRWSLIYADDRLALFSARAAPSAQIRFFAIDRLGEPEAGIYAAHWIENLAASGRRDLIQAAVREIGGARRIPGPLFAAFVVAGAQTGDKALVGQVLGLLPLVTPGGERDRRRLQVLAAQARSQFGLDPDPGQ